MVLVLVIVETESSFRTGKPVVGYFWDTTVEDCFVVVVVVVAVAALP
jgi:hypothetical protein